LSQLRKVKQQYLIFTSGKPLMHSFLKNKSVT
jgi:hypothetical protein